MKLGIINLGKIINDWSEDSVALLELKEQSKTQGQDVHLFSNSESQDARMCAKSLQSCLTICDSVDSSPPSSSVHGILQARILEWITMPSSRGSSWLRRDQTHISCIKGGFFTTVPLGKTCTQESSTNILVMLVLAKNLFRFFCTKLWISNFWSCL